MIIEYEEKLLDCIDNMVTHANDDELFAGGYLRGHISLAAAKCEEEEIQEIDVLKEKVTQSLKDNANELSPKDRHYVMSFWLDLQERIEVL